MVHEFIIFAIKFHVGACNSQERWVPTFRDHPHDDRHYVNSSVGGAEDRVASSSITPGGACVGNATRRPVISLIVALRNTIAPALPPET